MHYDFPQNNIFFYPWEQNHYLPRLSRNWQYYTITIQFVFPQKKFKKQFFFLILRNKTKKKKTNQRKTYINYIHIQLIYWNRPEVGVGLAGWWEIVVCFHWNRTSRGTEERRHRLPTNSSRMNLRARSTTVLAGLGS